MINEITLTLSGYAPFQRLVESLNSPQQPVVITGVSGSLVSVMLTSLQGDIQRQCLIVTSDREQAIQLHEDFLQFGASAGVFGVEKQGHPTSVGDHPGDVETLRVLTTKPPGLLVVPGEALFRKLPPPLFITQQVLELRRGVDTDFSTTTQLLAELGFQKSDFVEARGDFAVRGGILDVFPFAGDHPVRVEFFGDRIESIREFDALSQRSIKELELATVVPNTLSEESPNTEHTATIVDFISPQAVIFLLEPELIRRSIERNVREDTEDRWSAVVGGLSRFTRADIVSIPYAGTVAADFSSVSQPAINGNTRFLRQTLSDLQQRDYQIFLTCDTQSELARLKDLLADRESDDENEETVQLDLSRLTFTDTSLFSGFRIDDLKIAVFTEHQIFNRLKRRGGKRKPRLRGFSEKEARQLRRGDFVVHTDHGIGKFDGLKKITVQGTEQEVLTLSYDGGDTLYVNLNYLNRVQRFSSKEGHVPKLTRLGRPDWEKLKARAKKRIKDIARDLIKLYAKRKSTQGFAFVADTPWQMELEASFMYEDTFDQAKATREVKQDMEAPAPMDRLICGDVGFGKTEVAVRAAFKAVMSGKQAAVLVPTTILALQHLNTFIDRTSRYSINVRALTRFNSKAEQTSITEALKTGGVDVIIGTHRLLSKDVLFKDLGLLIIDEEHRFGVTAKEKLRRIKANVDTLTLTATPIPRTLHFSLMGARDLSIIATPPRNRRPVITEVTQYSDDLIRDAIIKETGRSGQVYFVHDRVSNIEDTCKQIQRAVPGVRVRYAHGQMQGHELEEVMLDFLEKKFDVLVCTKIIESGLDIPNVNTIIINRADRFGMAELYQLRGRVGRSNVQAYAYLLTPPLGALPKNTLLRLQAVEEFTELGSGFHLAMRDLEIRGAGNLLGAEQSGFIETMGFETYTRILEEAVGELKDEEFQDLFAGEIRQSLSSTETIVDSTVSALIPKSYVENDAERLEIYRRLYAISSQAQLDEMVHEVRDRFGPNPTEFNELISIIRVKLLAAKIGFRKVKIGQSGAELQFPPSSNKRFYESEDFQQLMTRIASSRSMGVILKNTKDALVLTANFGKGYMSKSPSGQCLELLSHLVHSQKEQSALGG
ncbi:MAG: transcription-repair coupling factor [Bacteroidota bacterium]